MRTLCYSERVEEPRAPSPSLAHMARVLREEGGSDLTDLDLLALIVGSAPGESSATAAGRLLEAQGWTGLLAGPRRAPWWGALGPRRGARLAAALELARRLGTSAAHPTVHTPEDVYQATADLRPELREHFIGLYLNTRHRMVARETISVGSLNASIVHPREVFEPALRHRAASLIVVHNHPSGETDPSEDDLRITRRLLEAGEILGITLVDHVIVGCLGYTSLKEEGHL